jgi:8-oxo-dGTP diphosphatase
MGPFSHHSANELLIGRVYVENSPTFVLVVAAAVSDGEGRFLLQQCPAHKRHASLWEFPGGKVEPEEIPTVALCREVFEELGLELFPGSLKPAGFAEDPPADGRPAIVLLLYTAEAWSGLPDGREGQTWGWFSPAEAAALAMPPMDRDLLDRLTG